MPAADDDLADVMSSLSADFWADESRYDPRKTAEHKRARTKKQRQAAAARPKLRTEYFGVRTTPEVAGLVKQLQAQLDTTATDVIERAIVELAEREARRS